MALSSGTRQASALAGAWLVAVASAGFSVLYFAELKAVARGILGIQVAPVEQTSASVPQSAPAVPRPVEARGAVSRGRIVELRAGNHGHYFASAEINGRSIDVLVDSGASIVALTYEDAQRAGVGVRDSDYTHRVSTANGLAKVAPVTLDRVSIGDITVRNVQAAVSEPGKLGTSLLGMSFLGRLQQIDIRSGVLVLKE
jgi:aspartyl protease family protein